MKITWLIILFLNTDVGCLAQGAHREYIIQGKINGIASGKIYLSVFGPSGERDSSEIKDGNFHFTGSLVEPSPVILCLERNFVNKPLFMFFVDKGKHTVELNMDDIRKGKAEGSAATRDFALLKSMEGPYDERIASASHLARDSSKAAQAEWEKIRSSNMTDRRAAQIKFIKTHSSSPVAAWALHRNFSYNPSDEATFAELYKLLSPFLHHSSYAASMKERQEKLEMLAIGHVAPDFTQNDTLDKPVSLIDFRGKYVLVDFWASWCVPCRKDNPNVVKAFNQFKDKGFTVLGISLDRPGKKAAWMNAIHQDGLTWTHISDLKYWDNAVARLYGIGAIPQNLLIDPQGRIIAKNIKGEELHMKLAEFLN